MTMKEFHMPGHGKNKHTQKRLVGNINYVCRRYPKLTLFGKSPHQWCMYAKICCYKKLTNNLCKVTAMHYIKCQRQK